MNRERILELIRNIKTLGGCNVTTPEVKWLLSQYNRMSPIIEMVANLRRDNDPDLDSSIPMAGVKELLNAFDKFIGTSCRRYWTAGMLTPPGQPEKPSGYCRLEPGHEGPHHFPNGNIRD